MRNHQDLDVWKRSMDIIEMIYKITKGFPDDERFGLVSQMRRSAVSVASNIAEGAGRISVKENIYFLGMARGSLMELQTQLIICDRIGIYSEDHSLMSIILSNKQMINGLIRYLRQQV